MSAALPPTRSLWAAPIRGVGQVTVDSITLLGDLVSFAMEACSWLVWRFPRRRQLVPVLHEVGVRSGPVVLVTGSFVGMVLAIQSYDQLRSMHLETRMGALINLSLVKELGPVLAATMMAGRVGSAMAAEIGTMRVTEQIDALRALGANPMAYLVAPRVLACTLMVPTLTVLADAVGMLAGWLIATSVLGVNSYYYWLHADGYTTSFDVASGLIKSVFFGWAIANLACHRGFHSRPGAEGVGQAATEAFVYSFIAILGLNFVLGAILLQVQRFFPMASNLMGGMQ